MDRTWKLVYRPTQPDESELYNLADDPHELNNVYAQHPDQVQRLKAILDEHNGYVTAPFTGGTAPDHETLERLKSLGYVGGDMEEDEPEEEPPAPPPATQPASQPTTQP